MDGEVIIPVDLDTKRFDRQIEYVETQLNDMLADYETMSQQKGFKEDSQDATNLRKEIEKLQNKLVSLNQQKQKWNQEQFNKINLDGISSATENIIRKVLKWGLALFSIRSAYSFIRSAVSTLSQSNEQIGADIEYIRWALATTLQPIIETIINLAYTLLQYINYIANAWFGVNLFAKASAENFKKTKDGVKGVNTEAKKLQKTLAGFDEMNILQEDGSTGRGGGGGGIALPSTDLSKMLSDVEIPGWVDWIAQNKDTIIGALTDIAKTFALFKILEWLVPALGMFGEGISKLGLILQSVGIVLIVVGLWNAMSDLLELITNPSWDTFYKLIGDLSLALVGLGLVLVGINASNPFGWVSIAIGGLGLLINALVDTTNEEEKERISMQKQTTAAEALKDARDKLTKKYDEYADAVQNAETKEKALNDIEKKTGISGKELYEVVKNNYNAYKEFSPEQRKVYDAYVDNQNAIMRLNDVTKEIIETKNKELANIGVINRELFRQGKAYDEDFTSMINGLSTGKTSWEDFEHTLSTILAGLDYEEKKLFVQTLPKDVQESARVMYEKLNNPLSQFFTGMQSVGNQANATFNSTIPNAVNKSNSYIDMMKQKLIDANNLMKKMTGVTIKTSFSTGGVGYAVGGIVTKLATGGIVNRPGKGVPVASSYMGEAGREGILPLTDSQAMETLGQAIGKYISLNATIPIYMGNRQIAREIQKIQAEDDFAYNGG